MVLLTKLSWKLRFDKFLYFPLGFYTYVECKLTAYRTTTQHHNHWCWVHLPPNPRLHKMKPSTRAPVNDSGGCTITKKLLVRQLSRILGSLLRSQSGWFLKARNIFSLSLVTGTTELDVGFVFQDCSRHRDGDRTTIYRHFTLQDHVPSSTQLCAWKLITLSWTMLFEMRHYTYINIPFLPADWEPSISLCDNNIASVFSFVIL